MENTEREAIMYDLRQAEGIIADLNRDAMLQMYASDGSGVRPVNRLLSDEQYAAVEKLVIGFLEDLVNDCKEEMEIKYELSSFGGRLKKLLEDRGMKQKDLALKVDITEATMSRYINNNRIPKATEIVKIAKALGVSPNILLGCEDAE